MTDLAIEVEDLGIFFKIYHKKGLAKRDAFLSYGKDLLKRAVRPSAIFSGPELFWALRNVSFTVKKGDVIGIVGENGSGKSTLLKTISGIFKPDEGRVSVNGKVGALIELGAGFHPELSGRDNVYLNGSILGMKKGKIDLIFDDIVGFSEMEEFIDTPIKNYSSGMKVRLGFSIAIHLDPEILLVDEVLAVGDLAFRMKCIDKMNEFRKRGVTILLVSHDLNTVRSFCEKAILLHHGKLVEFGTAADVGNRYFKMVIDGRQKSIVASPANLESRPEDLTSNEGRTLSIFSDTKAFARRASFQRIQNGRASFVNIQLLDEYGTEISTVAYGQTVILRMAVEILDDIDELSFAYSIRDNKGVQFVTSDSLLEERNLKPVHKGDRYIIDWKFTSTLSGGNYSIQCVLSIPVNPSAAEFVFCDSIPTGAIFNMEPREEHRILGGGIHWDNHIEVMKIA
jgi:lipopolysaccharide transport system ATP-binding protein